MSPAGFSVADDHTLRRYATAEVAHGWIRRAQNAKRSSFDLLILALRDGRFVPAIEGTRLAPVDNVGAAVDALTPYMDAFDAFDASLSGRMMDAASRTITWAFFITLGAISVVVAAKIGRMVL